MQFEMVKPKQQSSQSGVSRRTGLMLMTGVLLLAFGLAAQGLNTRPIWTDELYSVSNMGAFDGPYSPAQIAQSVASHFPDHVPLFFLLGAGWAQLVGWTQFALRLFSVFSGVLAIAWTYRFGSDVFNRRMGLLATLLLGTSAYMILYVHNFRMYPLLLMFAIMHTWFYWRLAHRYRVTRLTFFLFIATATALVYTHFFSIVWFAGLGFYHLVFVPKSRRWFRIVLGWGVGALCFLPYLDVLISGVRRASEKFNVTSVAASPGELISAFFHLLGNGSIIMTALFAGLLIWALWHKRDAVIVKFMLLSLAVLALIILLNEAVGLIPINRMRYFLILWVPCLFLFGYGLSLAPRWMTVICLLLWSIAGWQFYRSPDIRGYVGGMAKSYLYPPMQDYVYFLDGKVRPQDYLLGVSFVDYVNQDLKLGRSIADFYTGLHLGIDGAFLRGRAYGDEQAEDIREKIDGHPYLLLTYDPQNQFEHFATALSKIEADYDVCDVVVDEPNLFVQRYAKSVIGCERESYAPITYDKGVMLVDRFAKYNPNDNTVQILTGWEVEDERLLDEYNVSLQIITSDWQNTGRQTDRHLYEEEVLKWYGVELSTDGLPPGDYRVVVIVYDRETNKKVHGIDLNSGVSDDIFRILTFTIEPRG